jgi:surface polysaccharide O-acyltransferase-like enzyme
MQSLTLALLQTETVAVDSSRLNLLFALLAIAVLSVGLSALFSSFDAWGGGVWVSGGMTTILFVVIGYYIMEYHYLDKGYFLINFV